jgi:hypothetical protein
MVIQACNPSIWEAEAKDHESKAILGYAVRPCLNNKKYIYTYRYIHIHIHLDVYIYLCILKYYIYAYNLKGGKINPHAGNFSWVTLNSL